MLAGAVDVPGDVDLSDTEAQCVGDGVGFGGGDSLSVPGEFAQPLPRLLCLGACHGRHHATAIGHLRTPQSYAYDGGIVSPHFMGPEECR